MESWVLTGCALADVTSLIHTFPFIVKPIHEHNMVYYWDTTVWYWTGVAALVPQVSVCGDISM